MKKLFLTVAFAVSMSAGAFAAHSSMEGLSLGIGFRGDYLLGSGGVGNTGYGPAFMFKLPGFPPMFGVAFNFGAAGFNLGVTADWWLFKTTLASGTVDLCLYIGPGVYGSFSFASSYANIGVGLRIPVGLQLFIIAPFEIFLELAPAIGVGGIGNTIYFPAWGVQGNLGFRFWF
ncbi:MAG: DUF3996 domain-containing protein [Spirochaetota bacterium]